MMNTYVNNIMFTCVSNRPTGLRSAGPEAEKASANPASKTTCTPSLLPDDATRRKHRPLPAATWVRTDSGRKKALSPKGLRLERQGQDR